MENKKENMETMHACKFRVYSANAPNNTASTVTLVQMGSHAHGENVRPQQGAFLDELGRYPANTG